MSTDLDNETHIWTTHGLMPRANLSRIDGEVENDRERTTFQEWRLGNEIVRRDVHVSLKVAV